MSRPFIWILLFASAMSTAAAAEIRIRQAKLAEGVLTVRGDAPKPNSRVTLDGRFATTSDRNGRFSFKVRYAPKGCEAKIETGGAKESVSVAGCAEARAADMPPLTREPTPLIAEPGGGPPDVIFKTPRIVDPTTGDPADAFDVPENLVVPRE